MDDRTLSNLLMKKKRLEVLNTLLENKEQDFTISELSEKSEVGYKTTHSLVEKLENFGIINVDEKGGSKLVNLNQESPYIETLEKLGTIDSQPLRKAAENYAEEINGEFSEIKSVILFGSVLKGLPTDESDIDILILVDSEADREEVEEKIWAVRDRYEREENVNISPIVMNKEKFELDAENREPFARKVKEEGEILEGEPI
jgi:predicted nucleotidyltransferase/predicted transcriptional regulator